MYYILAASALYSISLGTILKTDNLRSALLFKTLPILFGIFQGLIALNYFKII